MLECVQRKINPYNKKGDARMCENTKEIYISRMTKSLPAMRNMLRLSQADLAEKLSVSRQQVVAIETNKRKMSWSLFLSLVLIFSMDEATMLMMRTFEIYTPELISIIEGNFLPTGKQSVGQYEHVGGST